MWQEWCIQMSLLKLWWPLEHSCSPTWKFWSASCTGARRKYRYLWSSAFCKREMREQQWGLTSRTETDGAASIRKYLSNVLSHIVICTQDRQLYWLSTANVYQFGSVAQSCLTLWLHGLQHARFPCPSPTPGACSNSCPSSQWYHPTISSSVIPFSSCLQSFPASGSFQMSQFYISGGQSIGASASVLPMNIQDWFPLELTGWISLQSKGLSGGFSNTTVQKHQFFGAQHSLWSNSHIHTWLLEKP